MEIKSAKMVKSLEGFCFKATSSVVKSYSISRTFAAHNEKGFVAASVF